MGAMLSAGGTRVFSDVVLLLSVEIAIVSGFCAEVDESPRGSAWKPNWRQGNPRCPCVAFLASMAHGVACYGCYVFGEQGVQPLSLLPTTLCRRGPEAHMSDSPQNLPEQASERPGQRAPHGRYR